MLTSLLFFRMTFVGARNGHCPRVLSFLNMNKYTPIPSLVFMVIINLYYFCHYKHYKH